MLTYTVSYIPYCNLCPIYILPILYKAYIKTIFEGEKECSEIAFKTVSDVQKLKLVFKLLFCLSMLFCQAVFL